MADHRGSQQGLCLALRGASSCSPRARDLAGIAPCRYGYARACRSRFQTPPSDPPKYFYTT